MRGRLLDMPRPLERPLVDDDLTLRVPELSDREVLARYASDEPSLDGAWLPLAAPDADPEAWAAWFTRELVLGWSPTGGRFGGLLVIDRPPDCVIGLVWLQRRQRTVAEISYGVAPPWRGRGIATRAARIATEWALSDGGFDRIEARIDQAHAGSRRVIEKAGFRLEDTFNTYVEGTGETCADALYARP